MDYDVILIHPPANYDFRKKAIFPGPIAYTVGGSTAQFIMPPVGLLSIAEYLSRFGYRTIVDNLADRMVSNSQFDAEKYIGDLTARVYAIDLHWCVHSQGAIEIARLCKKLHPDAMVILGGLTSSVFHEEIVRKFDFIDGVIRGEGEKPFLALMRALDNGEDLTSVPNLTRRNGAGEICAAPLMEVDEDLDEYEFTRLDFLEPKRAIFTPGLLPGWVVPISRGCTHNCVSCGGSAYSYRTYFGRTRPAFRSPEKIAADLRKLSDQGVELVFLFQDPRTGGKEYWQKLFKTLQNEDIRLRQITMELFGPADEEYIRELSRINARIVLTISPESGVDRVRGANGRRYSNEGLFQTIELCKKYGVALGAFSMIALGDDTPETVQATWEGWEYLCALRIEENAPVDYAFGPMVLLDPGSLAFDRPSSYGYRLLFKDFEDYYRGLSLPSWHQWISYETKFLDREAIIRLIIDSLEFSINLRERCGFFDSSEAKIARYWYVEANRAAICEVDEAMQISDEWERTRRLIAFGGSLGRGLITE